MNDNKADWNQEVLVLDGGRRKYGSPRVHFVPPANWIVSSSKEQKKLLSTVTWELQGGVLDSMTYQAFARKPDEPEWHSVRYLAGEKIYRPVCGALSWDHTPSVALADIVNPGQIGPVCKKCQGMEFTVNASLMGVTEDS